MPGPALHDLIAKRLRASISKNEGLGARMSNADYVQFKSGLLKYLSQPVLDTKVEII